jgi:hypothetical protein
MPVQTPRIDKNAHVLQIEHVIIQLFLPRQKALIRLVFVAVNAQELVQIQLSILFSENHVVFFGLQGSALVLDSCKRVVELEVVVRAMAQFLGEAQRKRLRDGVDLGRDLGALVDVAGLFCALVRTAYMRERFGDLLEQ